MHANNGSAQKREHALVMGGSMAGMLAARVLADHFERVTIVERDHFPEEPLARKGVPQARHVHVLLKHGRITLERLFPGLQDEMVAAGAPLLDMAADAAWLTPAGWGVRFPSHLALLAFSRDLLDWSVHRRLTALENVLFVEDCDVTGLLANAGGTGVAGARVRSTNQRNRGSEEQLRADLVVDASGRGSRAPRWLAELGYTSPQETTINAHVGYASRVYRRPAGFQGDWKVVFVQAAPPDFTRGGLLQPVEGGRWMLTLVGGDRDYPPTDEAGFMEFARSLRSPMIYESIKDAETLSPIYRYRATENRLRHYERLSRWPENLLIMGDAACAFNPVYAQGMTTAALGVETLERCLSEQHRRKPNGDLTGLARGFQKKLAKVNSAPWTLATGEDYRYLGTEGGTPDRMTRFMHRYMDQVMQLSTKDANVRLVLLEVFNLLKPPTALFRPGILARVLRHAATGRIAADEEAEAGSRLPKVA